MAIGWMYREDYARGGIRLTATQPDTHHAAQSSVVQALFYAVLMIPVSLSLSWLHVTGLPYTIVATALGLWYLYATIRFARIARTPDETANTASARNLLKVSVIYLPLLMLAMILDAKGRLLF
jgi:protoheme IX farnesyltransferase